MDFQFQQAAELKLVKSASEQAAFFLPSASTRTRVHRESKLLRDREDRK